MTGIPLRDDPARPPYKGRTLIERVVARIAFTPVAQLGVKDSEFAASFQEAIRRDYPLFEAAVDTFINVKFEGGSVSSAPEELRKWLFRDIAAQWTVALTQDALVLEGSREGYSSWTDFVARLNALVIALKSTAGPSHVLRLGIRYINTAPAEGNDDPRLVCAQQLTSVTGNADVKLADLFWVMETNEGELLLRSGVMPPASSYDPAMFMQRNQKTWYLDIDVINSDMIEFEPQAIEAQLRRQASRAHAIYYWAVPDGESA
ncbi:MULTISPECIES: TIGR04255 family protein [Sphingomonas]|uniref:TIGR04255 family protein n=1 Tax=Sphingomonas TaxID=13687 RepID=UPI000DF019A4|nr:MULTISPECIES: TIGR04255 family protein [Sphingomonas]